MPEGDEVIGTEAEINENVAIPDGLNESVEVSDHDDVDTDDNDDSESDSPVTGTTHELAYYEEAVEEIRRGDSYICMICTVEMDYKCRMFACKYCYRVFDYDCIREWALKSCEKNESNGWKCPNCAKIYKRIPAKGRATCWCGKVVNPDFNELNPNSCGQTCDAPICIHGCSKICHLGPHAECTRLVSIKCQCGKNSREIPCYENKLYDKQNGYHCGEICGLPLACGIHKCRRECHSGLCGPCPEVLSADKERGITIRCYCGETNVDKFNCKDVTIPHSAKVSKNLKGEQWIGVFQCKTMRDVEYACGHHSFVEGCVAPPTLPKRQPCPFSPKLLKTCPCGKTPLETLAKPRTKCTDPIPHCDKRCGKPLKCGKHTCPFTCHEGPCMDPCLQVELRKCRCGQRKFLVPCGFEGKPHCTLKCHTLMSCKRHRCQAICCPGRPKVSRRKKVLLDDYTPTNETEVEPEHICLRECNLMLSCGKHRCKRTCHAGKCPPCLESDSNDLVCPCGRTIVPAPVRCGTKLPPCPYPCIKVIRGESECGHPPAPHRCHPLDEPCPLCTVTVFRKCKCGKNDKVRTLCFQRDVSCGKVCGKPLPFCHHKCLKTCHLPGECQTTCKQICGLKRVNCEHKCVRPCHGKSACPDVPCTELVEIFCLCGRKHEKVTCGATSTTPSRKLTEHLECDDECEIYKRHQQLRLAFGIDDSMNTSTGAKLGTTTGGDSNVDKTTQLELERLGTFTENAREFEDLQLPFTESALRSYAASPQWCEKIQSALDDLMRSKTRGSLHFKPMRASLRHFIHELSKAYKLYSESQDKEPKRSVFVKKNPDSRRPAITLADALPLYQKFKTLEKERKQKEFEAHTTVTLVNVSADALGGTNSDVAVPPGGKNGFLIKNLTSSLTEDDLKSIFGKYLKPTLIKDPEYKIVVSSDTTKGLIYPTNYKEISRNVVKDMDELVGHLNLLVREDFIGDGVELCNVDKELGDTSE